MEVSEVHRLIDTIAAPAEGADGDRVRSVLADARRVGAWLARQEARWTRRLAQVSPQVEADVAAATKTTVNEANRAVSRSETLERLPAFDQAMDDGAVSADHVDVLSNALRGLQPIQQQELLADVEELVGLAAATTAKEFARTLRRRSLEVQERNGMKELERQRRANRLKMWIDHETGMGHFTGQLDPVSFMKFEQLIQALTRARIADGSVPEGGPLDPLEQRAWLQALALMDLIDGKGGSGNGRSEVVVVVDTRVADADGCPVVDWGLPVDIPPEVLIDLINGTDECPPASIVPVVVDGGRVVQTPGRMRRGRERRNASRDQRRALRALYPTCAIPDCPLPFSRTHIHHIREWGSDGETDLDNLLPLCSRHHHLVHDGGWHLTLLGDRTLIITLPDGRQMTTGPPKRRAA